PQSVVKEKKAKAVETGNRKRGRPPFASTLEKRARKQAELEKQDASLVEAAIAEAERNAEGERRRTMMPVMERKREDNQKQESVTRKRVHFAPLPEKHHAYRMPAKRRKIAPEREGEVMRKTVPFREFASFSSFDVSPSASFPLSLSSPDRSGRRASIIEAMKARASQLVRNEDEEWEDVRMKEAVPQLLTKFSGIPAPIFNRPKKIVDEVASDAAKSTVVAPTKSVRKTRKTPAKRNKLDRTKSSEKKGIAKKKKTSTNKKIRMKRKAETKKEKKLAAAAAAARKKEKARVAKIQKLKREIVRSMAKSSGQWNTLARSCVEEENLYWKVTREVTPLEQKEWTKRLFSWPEIHNIRRKMAIEVEPIRKEGEKKAESLHSVSTSLYLSRVVNLTKRYHDGVIKVVKSFSRARPLFLDWKFEEKEMWDALVPTTPSLFVEDGEVRCL
ncbi:hypothetical protein PMAYCL1PPCAC_28980, partial [Pristionchus mayeri]